VKWKEAKTKREKEKDMEMKALMYFEISVTVY
jgi:hypothetical protein